MKFAVSSLLLLLALLVTAMAQESCPDEVDLSECGVDPCEGQMCPRFYNAECRPNLCFGGLCTANFFFRNSNVTDRCTVLTCDTRTCPGTRQCMEEVRPPACPPERPNCRQALHTRCFLPPVMDRPMTCMDMDCMDGEVCRMRLRGDDFPPVVNCWPPERVSDCVPGTCNAGLVCVDDGPSVQCVTPPTTVSPTNSTAPPTTPTALPTNSTATSTAPPTNPTAPPITPTASPTNTTTPPTTPTALPTTPTAPPTDTSTNASPSPTPSVACQELRCESNRLICVEDDLEGARCQVPSNCEEFYPLCTGQNMLSTCIELPGILRCLAPPSCEMITCGDFERCLEVQLSGALNQVTAVCLPTTEALSCEELECRSETDICRLSNIPNLPNSTLAECVSPSTLTLPTCDNDPLCNLFFSSEEATCVDLTQNGEVFSPFCTLLNCEQRGCPFDFTCIEFTNAPFTSACRPNFFLFSTTRFGTPCSERTESCDQELVCQEIVLNGSTILGSFCGPPQIPLQQESCDNAACQESEVCIVSVYSSQPKTVRARCTNRENYLSTTLLYQGEEVIPTVLSRQTTEAGVI